jgi:hypothetical protein
VTGTLAGMRRGYDIIGVFALAFVTAVGGGLIRGGIFIQAGPPAVLTGLHYLPRLFSTVDVFEKGQPLTELRSWNRKQSLACLRKLAGRNQPVPDGQNVIP